MKNSGKTAINRIILIVLDSVGIGAQPDADEYDDIGADTLGHIAEKTDLKLPVLEKMGLGKIRNLQGIKSSIKAEGAYGKLEEASKGKDTTTGHWELAGIISEKPFPVYPDGFPDQVIEPFKKAINRDILGNKPASGTKIIEELGQQHIKTGKPIVYTSADSVFQIAAHEEVIPVADLYQICREARKILKGEHGVGRVIARPFVGEPGNFKRTERRKDFSLTPPQATMLDHIKEAGLSVCAAGKIDDVFAGRGFTDSVHVIDNMETVDAVMKFMEHPSKGLIFANLVEFDMVYGHRRDAAGYARALMDFDRKLPHILNNMRSTDILIITADHGCDPTYKGTDHTREYVPLLIYGDHIKPDVDLHIRSSFADVAATITEILGVQSTADGTSFMNEVVR